MKINKDSYIFRIVTWLLVAVIIIVIGILVFNYKLSSLEGEPVQQARELDIKTFSLGGEVVATSAEQITLKTGWIENGEFVYYDRFVKINGQTKIFTISSTGTNPVNTNNPSSYIKVGDKITVSGAGNPYTVDTVTATKIEIRR
jgi:hypothetical protein